MIRALFYNYKHVPKQWMSICPNFQFETGDNLTSIEGSFLYDEELLTMLQLYRNIAASPVSVNSLYRSELHNANAGGKPNSEHPQGRAVDIGRGRRSLSDSLEIARQVGFSGMGFYTWGMHCDTGRRRMWFGGQQSKKLWTPILEAQFDRELT